MLAINLSAFRAVAGSSIRWLSSSVLDRAGLSRRRQRGNYIPFPLPLSRVTRNRDTRRAFLLVLLSFVFRCVSWDNLILRRLKSLIRMDDGKK